MTLHFSFSAASMLRMIRSHKKPCSGWITGTVLGQTWMVDNLVAGDFPYSAADEDMAIAIDAWQDELIGEFFAFREPGSLPEIAAGLVILIFSDRLEVMDEDGKGTQPIEPVFVDPGSR